MIKMKIRLTDTFIKRYKKIPEVIKSKVIEKEGIFLTDPFSPALKTHKLTGKMKDYWSFSVNYQYRIVFRFLSEAEIAFVDIGTHSIYK